MRNKPRRRWFRFSLRTMLVVVTILSVWLAWESSVVRQRRTALAELRASGAYQVVTAEAWSQQNSPFAGLFAPPKSVSWMRKWLGDEAVQEIWYSWYPAPTESELAHLRKVFPEAEVREIPAEPCHPGCFPRGTLVDTPSGPRPIEFIQPGQRVTTVGLDGITATAEVQFVFITDNRLWRIETEAGHLFTTETQPLCRTVADTVAVGKLRPLDEILFRDEESFCSTPVLAVLTTDRVEQVFNLVLRDGQLFVAGGFLARSKPPTTEMSR
jgi:hypothetical protein